MWARYGIAATAGFMAALLLVAAVLGVRSLVGGLSDEAATVSAPTGPAMNDESAIAACREVVAGALKNPDSATFDDEVAEQSDNEISWEVTGTVRATNGFGGVVPTSFVCYATWQGDHFEADADLLD